MYYLYLMMLKVTLSSGTLHSWMNKHRPHHTIFPHKSDYCDTCAESYKNIQEINQVLKRKQKSGNATLTEINDLKYRKHNREHTLNGHKKEALEGQEVYKESITKCDVEFKAITFIYEMNETV